jgi:DNA-binding transcriptional regulator YdaS (Cro superfamily)
MFSLTILAAMDKLQRFIDSYGGSALAERLGVSKAAVSSWRNGRWRVPAERCRAIQELSNGAVSVHDIRPDVFGPATDQPKAA